MNHKIEPGCLCIHIKTGEQCIALNYVGEHVTPLTLHGVVIGEARSIYKDCWLLDRDVWVSQIPSMVKAEGIDRHASEIHLVRIDGYTHDDKAVEDIKEEVLDYVEKQKSKI